jgi:hypothetical protein
MTQVQDSAFLSSGTVNYPSGDNVVDVTKTAIVSANGKSQTLQYNAAGKLLSASNPA